MQRCRLLLLLFATLLSQGAKAQAIPEYEMKTTFLYNFSLLTEWPAIASETFNICVLGQDNFGPALKKIEGKMMHGRPINIARLSSLSSVKKCQLLFIAEKETGNMPRILSELADSPVLTVTDSSATPPGAITLTLEGQRLLFDINIQRVKNSSLYMSSKLLKLARVLQ